MPSSIEYSSKISANGLELSSYLSASFISSAQASEGEGGNVKWTCPMHPHYIAEEFGACPICGMDLVKLSAQDNNLQGSETEKRTQISIPPETIQAMGVRISKAESANFGRSIRSYGIVRENERLRVVLSARVEGWIENLNIKAIGDEVKKGDLLYKLYSPQLVVSQDDYLSPYTNARNNEKVGTEQLKNFGVQDQVMAKINKSRKSLNHVPFYAEQNGIVSEINITKGSYVKRGSTIAKIQDYSTVWILVNVQEKDLGFITKDTSARVKFPNLPNKEVMAKVDYIYPTVDANTRTGRVRLIVDNKNGLLRPGTYSDVTFEVGVERRVSVPSEAILKNESGNYVVLSLGEGRFEPRNIKLGLSSNKWTEVKQGLSEGDEVVVSGQFLLDSESALRESFRKLQRLQLPLSLVSLDKTEFAMIDHMIDAALYIHEALIDGYDVDAKFLDPAISIKELMWPRYKDTKLAFVLSDAEGALKTAQKAKTESELKLALNQLIIALMPWMQDGAPQHYQSRKVSFFQESSSGKSWIQIGDKAINPYGSSEAKRIPWEVKSDTTDGEEKSEARKLSHKSDRGMNE